jgi:hypothetical protein
MRKLIGNRSFATALVLAGLLLASATSAGAQVVVGRGIVIHSPFKTTIEINAWTDLGGAKGTVEFNQSWHRYETWGGFEPAGHVKGTLAVLEISTVGNEAHVFAVGLLYSNKGFPRYVERWFRVVDNGREGDLLFWGFDWEHWYAPLDRGDFMIST